jgi:hypothetical protein
MRTESQLGRRLYSLLGLSSLELIQKSMSLKYARSSEQVVLSPRAVRGIEPLEDHAAGSWTMPLSVVTFLLHCACHQPLARRRSNGQHSSPGPAAGGGRGVCLGPYGGPRGGPVSYERGTPVLRGGRFISVCSVGKRGKMC